MPQVELGETRAHLLEVVVVEFVGQHREEPRESRRAEFGSVVAGDRPKPFEDLDEHLQDPHGSVQDHVRRSTKEAEMLLLLPLDGLDSEFIDLRHDRRVVKAVSQDMLTVDDGGRIAQAGQHDALGDVEQERIAIRPRSASSGVILG
ncbi:MAG TPA: hypothetical protein VFW65_05365 [Pseudonocardiaceae bacterium]|nr:hypothetical protein [Pseudonocardiaceae bacterium]